MKNIWYLFLLSIFICQMNVAQTLIDDDVQNLSIENRQFTSLDKNLSYLEMPDDWTGSTPLAFYDEKLNDVHILFGEIVSTSKIVNIDNDVHWHSILFFEGGSTHRNIDINKYYEQDHYKKVSSSNLLDAEENLISIHSMDSRPSGHCSRYLSHYLRKAHKPYNSDSDEFEIERESIYYLRTYFRGELKSYSDASLVDRRVSYLYRLPEPFEENTGDCPNDPNRDYSVEFVTLDGSYAEIPGSTDVILIPSEMPNFVLRLNKYLKLSSLCEVEGLVTVDPSIIWELKGSEFFSYAEWQKKVGELFEIEREKQCPSI